MSEMTGKKKSLKSRIYHVHYYEVKQLTYFITAFCMLFTQMDIIMFKFIIKNVRNLGIELKSVTNNQFKSSIKQIISHIPQTNEKCFNSLCGWDN